MRTAPEASARNLSKLASTLPAHLAATDVTVEPVRTAKDRDAFIQFQVELYSNDPFYVPPIAAERRDFLDREKNVFLRHAELELWLARRHGKIVGRVAAVNDPNYNQFHNTEVGFFGLFESIDDAGVANALLDAAREWVASKGQKSLMGPVNLSFNHDVGVLIEGFELPPAMMMPYNPRYYDRLLTAAGFGKAKDLWSWELSTAVPLPEKAARTAEKLRNEDGIRVRPIDMKDLHAETRRIKTIYNAMLERSWGFVPMEDDEFDAIAARLRPLVMGRPELCLLAEAKGPNGFEPVAFSLTLPDSNVALKAANGRLTNWGLPVGLAKLLWAARSIDRLRVLLLGVKPSVRKRGIETLLCVETLRVARELGFVGGEIGWAAEDNDLLNRTIEGLGARRFKTYRLYERAV